MLNSVGNFLIDPRGDIYNCLGGVGEKVFMLGNINDDFNTLFLKLSKFIEMDKCAGNEECTSCKYLPMCAGGCSFESYVNFGSINKIVCVKDQLEIEIPNVLKLLYIDKKYDE